MNYASTNEPQEPMILLDAEGMAASVDAYMQSDEYKQKLAERQANMSDSSKAAEVARLEDLAPELMALMLEVAEDSGLNVDYALWEPLAKYGLIDHQMIDDSFYGCDILTPRGEALVREYQQRQAASELQEGESTVTVGEIALSSAYGHIVAALEEENAALKAENKRLLEELKLWPSRLTEIEELAWDYQGEWAAVDEVYAPNWTQGYKRILAEIEDHKQHREALQPQEAQS